MGGEKYEAMRGNTLLMAIPCLCVLCMLLKPNAFAANLGGGLDLRANRRILFRLIEAGYLITTFASART